MIERATNFKAFRNRFIVEGKSGFLTMIWQTFAPLLRFFWTLASGFETLVELKAWINDWTHWGPEERSRVFTYLIASQLGSHSARAPCYSHSLSRCCGPHCSVNEAVPSRELATPDHLEWSFEEERGGRPTLRERRFMMRPIWWHHLSNKLVVIQLW